MTVKNGDKARAVAVARDLVALGFGGGGHQGHGGGDRCGRHPGEDGQQGQGRPAAHRRHGQGRRDPAGLHHGGRDPHRDCRLARYIRTAALANRVTYYTTMAGAEAATEALKHQEDLTVFSLQEMHAELL
jgi:carbamoyl-phosphate synthase large subunit